jgi:hypothetical protein
VTDWGPENQGLDQKKKSKIENYVNEERQKQKKIEN